VDSVKGKTLIVYSDIIFDRQILCRLLESPYQITLVIDRAYQTLPLRNKRLDLVSVKQAPSRPTHRQLDATPYRTILRLGKTIDQQCASHEFIGIAFFREQGLQQLRQVWAEARSQFHNRPFYEATGVEQAGFTDVLQYLIDRGHPVSGLEIEHGWSEVHSLEDYKRLNDYFQAAELTVATTS
jgi:phosphoenolpyruvate phosphomutase